MKCLYQNKECGNIWESRIEAIKEANELYDFSDPTNNTPLSEYYEILWESTEKVKEVY